MLKNLFVKNYSRFRQIKREFVEKTITFANTIKKLQYNTAYIDLQLTVEKYVYFYLYNNYIIPNLINKKLN